MRFLRFFIHAVGPMCFLAMIAGYFGWLHPAFDSFSAFRLHLAVLTVVSGFLLVALRSVLGGLSIAIAAGVVLFTMHATGPSSAEAASEPAARYRLLQINVRYNNPTPKELLRLIGQLKPDVITAQEITSRWRNEFETIKAAYPYQLFCAAHRKIGDVAILSRRPFVEADTNYCGGGEAIAIQSIRLGDQTVAVASTHLFWPWPHQQPRQLHEMRPVLEMLGKNPTPKLIAGDLNAPRWSQAAREIAAHSATSAIDYKGGSWLALEFPTAWTRIAGLAIDNVFQSGLIIFSAATQTPVGSDHLPMLIEFSVPVRDAEEAPKPLVG